MPTRMREWAEGVSVIVPVKNAAALLPAFLDNLLASNVLEVLLCDLGSSDDTVAIAATRGVSVIRGSGTESFAVSEAIKRARGSIFWFLSARSRPVADSANHIVNALDQQDVVGGYFYLALSKWSWRGWLRMMYRNASASMSGHITLEHGLFVDREAYRHIGGLPEGRRGLSRFLEKLSREGHVVCLGEPIHYEMGKAPGMNDTFFE